ncbi:hypothetical protein [Streptomyces brevispora]|uniref:hypothetical protein n=1 Tax=Streptomyces brevispora TaxID=887462 RepID=UPI00382ACE04
MATPTNPIERLDLPLAEVEAQLLRRREAKVTRKQGRAGLHRADEVFPSSAAILTVDSKTSIEPGA